MGKRYTQEEINQIQTLSTEGYMDREIATRLGRSEDGIRNIRHSMKLKIETRESIHSLMSERRNLNEKAQKLKQELSSLQTRKEQVSKALHTEEKALNQKLYTALLRMKDLKPELFYITAEEQLGKLTAQLATSFIRWLIE